MLKKIILAALFILIFSSPSPAKDIQINLVKGWNLVNSPLKPADTSVSGIIGPVKEKIASLWKWENDKWAVYLPGYTDYGAAYAVQKGFTLLQEINPGEGFWVNADTQETFSLNISGTYMDDSTLSGTKGWNLVGLKTDQGTTVSDLFSSVADKLVSVWAWVDNQWSVYLFGAGQDTEEYAAQKGFTVLSQITPTRGFWINAEQDPGKFPPLAGAKVLDQTSLGTYAPVQGAEVYYKDVKIAETDLNGQFGVGTVYGMVIDSQGTGLNGVEVSTDYGIKVTSLPNGAYLLMHPPGSFTLTCKLAGYSTIESTIEIASLGFQEINLSMTPQIGKQSIPDLDLAGPESAQSTGMGKISGDNVHALYKYQYAAEDLTLVIKAEGFIDKSVTVKMGTGVMDYFFIRQAEVIPEPVFEDTGLDGTEVPKGEFDVSDFKICPNLFVLEIPPEAIPAAPTPKVISDDQSAIIITKMKLPNDITVAVNTFSSVYDIDNMESLNEAMGAAQLSHIIGGADVLVSDSSGNPTTSDAAGFTARVRAVTLQNMSSLTFVDMKSAIAEEIGGLYLFYYNEDQWKMAGEGAIELTESTYRAVPGEGVFFEGLFPFVFVYGGKKIITGRVVVAEGGELMPVPNALISIRKSIDTVVSGRLGTFSLSIPDTLTSVTLKVIHEDYRIKGITVNFVGNETKKEIGDISLSPLAKKTLKGKVTTHLNAPIVNADVVLTILEKPDYILLPDVIRAKTGSDGSYAIPGLAVDILGKSAVNVIMENGYDPGFKQSIPESQTETVTLDFSFAAPLWIFQTNGNIYSSPTIDGGNVYIGSCDGKLHCLDAESGTSNWAYTTNPVYEPLPIFTTPAVDESKVYFGTLNNQFYALNKDTGVKSWYTVAVNAFASPSENTDIISSTVLAGDNIFFGSSDTGLYAFQNNGSPLWSQYKGGNITTTPVLYNDLIYVGSWDGYFYCHRTGISDNGLEWRYPSNKPEDLPPLPGRILSSPAIADGRVYFGGGNNITEDGTAVTDGDTNIYCLNAANGTEVWKYATGGAIVSSPAIANGKLYIGSLDWKVYCLNADSGGAPIWTFTTGGEVYSSPVVSNGKVYIGSNDKYLYCLDAATGSKLWSLKTRGPVISSPKVSNGKIYFGSLDGMVYCVEE